jgi:hypothetical protein
MRDHSITLRITDEENTILSTLSEKTKTSKSDLIRDSVYIYFNLFLDVQEKPAEHLVFHEKMLSYLLSIANEDQIKHLADLSFDIGMKEDVIDKTLKADYNDPLKPENFEFQLKMLTTHVFSSKAQRWMTKAEFSQNKDKMIFGGRHKLGKNFSIFIQYLLENYARYFHWQIEKAETESDRVVITFIMV